MIPVPGVAPLVLQCQHCGAALSVAAEVRTTTCPYCASPSVVTRPATPDRPTPRFAIGFVLTAAGAEERVRRWLARQGFFRRQDLYRAHLEALRSVYVPAFLYSATAHAEYTARIGENYTETQTYTVTVNGRAQVRTRTVVKTEWRSLAGRYAAYVAPVLVTASRGLANAELEAVEPFDLRALHRYTPAVVSGWMAEEPSVALERVAADARAEALAQTGVALARFMPGDGHADLRHRTWLDREAVDLVLVPVCVLALRYDPNAPPLRVLVNGQTGRIHGHVPWSTLRIALVVGTAVAVVVLLVVAGGR